MFIKIVDMNGRSFLVNVDQIVAVVPGGEDGQASIYTTANQIDAIRVSGNYEEIIQEIMNAAR